MNVFQSIVEWFVASDLFSTGGVSASQDVTNNISSYKTPPVPIGAVKEMTREDVVNIVKEVLANHGPLLDVLKRQEGMSPLYGAAYGKPVDAITNIALPAYDSRIDMNTTILEQRVPAPPVHMPYNRNGPVMSNE